MNLNCTGFMDLMVGQSLHLAVLFVLIGLLTAFFRKQSAHLRYLLWLIVLVKCLVPPLLTIPMAILPQEPEPAVVMPESLVMDTEPFDAVGSVEVTPVVAEPSPTPSIHVTPSPIDEMVAAAVEPEELPVSQTPSLVWYEQFEFEHGLLLLWLSGTVILALATLYRAFRFGRWIQRARQPLDESLVSDIEALGDYFEPAMRVRIYTLDGISQPFVWGLWRGGIYVPANFEQSSSPTKRSSVLLHEMAHVWRMDPLVNLLQIMVQMVYWFHPLVWITNRFIRAEREKCCDEIAIAKLKTSPKEYGSAIVETLVQEYQSRRAVPSLAVAGPVKNIEDRIKTIMKPGKQFYSQPTFKALLVTLLLAVIAVPTTIALTQRPLLVEGQNVKKELNPEVSAIEKLRHVGHIEIDETGQGVVTVLHGDAVYGNDRQYTRELYRGRLKRGNRFELLDNQVLKNRLNRPVIKIKTLTASPTIPAGTVGWIDLVSTSFADQLVVQSSEEMAEEAETPTPSALTDSNAISVEDRQELERLIQVSYGASFLNDWQAVAAIIDFESEQQKQRYKVLFDKQLKRTPPPPKSDHLPVHLVQIDSLEDHKVVVSALYPMQGHYMPVSMQWTKTKQGWKLAVDLEEEMVALGESMELPPEELSRKLSQRHLDKWLNAQGQALLQLYTKNLNDLRRRLLMIQYAQRENLPGADGMDEVRCQRDLDDLSAKTPQEHRTEMIRFYQGQLGPARLFGKLEFRIVPFSVSVDSRQGVSSLGVDEELRYRETLRQQGPKSLPLQDDYVWIPLRPGTNVSGLVTEPYQGQSYILLSNKAEEIMPSDGSWRLAAVYPQEDAMGRPSIGIELDAASGERMRRISRDHIGQHMAIVIDGQALSVPYISSEVGKHVIITGSFSEREVRDMVIALQKGMSVFSNSDDPNFKP